MMLNHSTFDGPSQLKSEFLVLVTKMERDEIPRSQNARDQNDSATEIAS